MKPFKKRISSVVLSAVTLFLLSVIPVYAQATQKISANLCTSVFDSVTSAEKPSKVYRSHIFSSECNLEFEIRGGATVLLSIEQYEGDSESSGAFLENSKDSDDQSRAVSDLYPTKAGKPWDDIALFQSERRFDTFLLLRKGPFLVQIFSDDRTALVRLEKLLRRFSFQSARN